MPGKRAKIIGQLTKLGFLEPDAQRFSLAHPDPNDLERQAVAAENTFHGLTLRGRASRENQLLDCLGLL